jgi:branched-chain amino acid aminotransferase
MAFHNGEFVRVADIALGPGLQGLHYGTGVFEGIRAYWDPVAERSHILKAREHYARMHRSARLLHIDLGYTADQLVKITAELIRRNDHREDIYIRPLAYKVALEPGTRFGVRLRGVSDGLTILTLPMGNYTPPGGIRCVVTSWRRVPDCSLPSKAKATGGYLGNALAVDQAEAAGCDDAIFLNQRGDVAEASTANLFVVRDGTVATPGLDSDILDGITRAAVIEMVATELGVAVAERPVARSELYSADELFLTGTGCQIAAVVEVDGRRIGAGRPGPWVNRIRNSYDQAARGMSVRYRHWLTTVLLGGSHPSHERAERANYQAQRG